MVNEIMGLCVFAVKVKVCLLVWDVVVKYAKEMLDL